MLPVIFFLPVENETSTGIRQLPDREKPIPGDVVDLDA